MKRKFIVCILFMCIVTILLGQKNNNVTEVISTPSTGKVIVLDAGHGIPDEGAVGFRGTTEQKINLEIVLKIQKLLEQNGSIVVITRSDEKAIYNDEKASIKQKKISDIYNRVDITNSSNADLLVSIHLNKFTDPKYSGWQTFYKTGSIKSKKIAEDIQEYINKNMNKTNNRIPRVIKDIYLIDNSEIPSVVVECGFISNNEESILLKENEYQNKIAWGIFMGIQEYFRSESNE
ncbi:MAG: N-acetylmuramoyl-L-alanine amidase [Clostridia bacterium]